MRSLTFHDLTLTFRGEVRSRRVEDADRLLPAAVELFRDLLERHGPDFRRPLPARGMGHWDLQWSSPRPSAALATFWCRGELATTSALVHGSDAAADREALDALQMVLNRVASATPVEPGFALAGIAERPAIVTLVWPNPRVAPGDYAFVADAERCLAAAYFLATAEGYRVDP